MLQHYEKATGLSIMSVAKIFFGSLLTVLPIGIASQFLAPDSFIAQFTASRSGASLLVIIVFVVVLLITKVTKLIGSKDKKLKQ